MSAIKGLLVCFSARLQQFSILVNRPGGGMVALGTLTWLGWAGLGANLFHGDG